MARVELTSEAAAETEGIAARLAASLETGDVVTVSGELGSGKTTFVRGAARALGVDRPVTSPTYTIGNRYGRVSHLDLYRLERVDAAEWGALQPYFEDAICFVEWPEAGAGWLPPARVAASLRHLDAARRLVVLESSEPGLLERVFGADPRA